MKVVRYTKLIRMLKFFKLNKFFHTIEDLISSEHVGVLVKFLKLNLLIFVVTHWIACFLYQVSIYTSTN
jgi:hypothetical protein